MAGRKPIVLPQPELGEEHGVTWWVNHNCPAARIYKAHDSEMESDEFGEDIDLLMFPVGLTGYGMPGDVPFEVQSANPCDACGKYLRSMFMWKKRLIIP